VLYRPVTQGPLQGLLGWEHASQWPVTQRLPAHCSNHLSFSLSIVELEIKLTALPGEPLEPSIVHTAAEDSMKLHTPAETIELEAHYYDDRDGLLRAARWSVRARREDHHIVATAKGPAPGVLARCEIETKIDRMPSVGDPLPSPLAEALAQAGVPLYSWPTLAFKTRVRRVVVQASLSGTTKAELAIDHGEVIADHQRHPICELELELKQGEAMGLLQGALALADQLQVRPGGRSKAARGLQMLGRLNIPSGDDPTDCAALWSRFEDLEEHLREGRHEFLGHYLRVADMLTSITALPRLQIAQDPLSGLDSPEHAAQLWQIFAAVQQASGANSPRTP